jgi:hypothetical protein
MPAILNLPNEVWIPIIADLPASALRALSCTCRPLRSLVSISVATLTQTRAFWIQRVHALAPDHLWAATTPGRAGAVLACRLMREERGVLVAHVPGPYVEVAGGICRNADGELWATGEKPLLSRGPLWATEDGKKPIEFEGPPRRLGNRFPITALVAKHNAVLARDDRGAMWDIHGWMQICPTPAPRFFPPLYAGREPMRAVAFDCAEELVLDPPYPTFSLGLVALLTCSGKIYTWPTWIERSYAKREYASVCVTDTLILPPLEGVRTICTHEHSVLALTSRGVWVMNDAGRVSAHYLKWDFVSGPTTPQPC